MKDLIQHHMATENLSYHSDFSTYTLLSSGGRKEGTCSPNCFSFNKNICVHRFINSKWHKVDINMCIDAQNSNVLFELNTDE